MITTFSVATKVVSGLGSLALLPAELAALGARRIAVVVDRGVLDAGLLATVLAPVDPALVAVTVPVDPDPDVAAAERAAAIAREHGCDAVLAVGGGSAQGAAKAVAIRLTNPERIDRYAGVGNVPIPPAPTIAVPTTAGSGSEVSQVLVLHEAGRPEELVVRSPGCEPDTALLDGTVLRGLPRAPMLHAGLDALAHGLETQWARRASAFTRALGLAAARTVLDRLAVAVDGVASGRNAEGGNDEVLQELLDAACAANMACGNTGLTLVHALSTAPSVHLPHGLQNGVLLPHVARFNADLSEPDVAELVAELPALYDALGFAAVFPSGSVGPAEVDAMVTASTGHPFRLNNGRASTDDELRELLAGAVV
ncbi:iron-containing alcohol dehydrogenase family protein [Pseudonocardia sp. TRM90224]|uniref:iron-containing alcohol dehydrogenase family protein n=1 Tax=Pseudonocardia sp. TRM90224 TaxID=2812678 RepID=UPI001E65037B|nr:iron-containing alcohol dehydrogenase [Pseudonocardia sp. TRM90224]